MTNDPVGMPRHTRETDAERRQREDLPWVWKCCWLVGVAISGGLAFAMMQAI